MMAARKSLQDVADFSKKRVEAFQDKRKVRAAAKATAQKEDVKKAGEKAKADKAEDKDKEKADDKP